MGSKRREEDTQRRGNNFHAYSPREMKRAPLYCVTVLPANILKPCPFFFASSRDCNRQRSPQHLPPSTQKSQTTAQHSTWFRKTNRHMRHIALGYIKTNKQHRAQEYIAEKEAHRVLPASRARFLFLSFFSFLRSRHGTVYTTTYKTIGIVCLLKLDTNDPYCFVRSGIY